MSTLRILIAGCGDVGTALALRLADEGHEVWGLKRRPETLPAPIRPLKADLTDPGTLRDLPKADYVVYTAAATHHDEDGYRRAYVEGLGNVLDAAQEQGLNPRRVLFTSSTGVYGQDDGSWVDETSATEPARYTGRLMLEAEARLHQSPWPSTVVRLGGIYGPGRLRLVDKVRQGGALLPPGPSYTNRIHRDDCAGALAHLVGLDLAGRSPASLYVGVDSAATDLKEVLVWLAERLGAPLPTTSNEPHGDEPRGAGKRCRNDLLVSTGWRPRYPSYRDGYDAVLRELEG
jgi:nucleoside-diphosphate-sugar epimerase